MIVLATPTRETVTAGFAGDLVKVCRRHPDVKFLAATGIYIANLRNLAVTMAQRVGATHILFIDSDMRFPEDTLDRLLAHQAPIVAANYVMRTMPELWVARRRGQSVSSVGQAGLDLVDSVGFGAILINMEVFASLSQPWFDTPFDGQQQIGEDLFFCQKATDEGFLVWIDHDLSQHVRHHALVEYGVRDIPVEVMA